MEWNAIKSKIMIRRNLILILSFLLIFSTTVHSQTVTESVYSLKEKYNPFFSSEASYLKIDYLKKYRLDSKKDVTHYLLVKVTNQNLVKTGQLSVGTSVFSSNYLSYVNSNATQYEVDVDQQEMLLDKERFYEFYDCAQNLYQFISDRQKFDKSPNNTVAFCKEGNLAIGAEFDPESKTNDPLKFYFQVGKATFNMNREDFEDVIRLVRNMKKDWDKYEK